MKKILSRQELYDLAWSKPLSQLAIDFEMSDVGLKKICKAAYIPTPTLGYWAKKQNGKKTVKTPLPTLLPFQSQRVYIGGRRTRYGYTEEQILSDEELAQMELPEPPTFELSQDEAKKIIEDFVTPIPIPSKITRVHPVLQKLVEAQANLLSRRYCFDKAKYAHPNGLKVLKALNSLFFYFGSLGFRVRMHGPSSQSLSIDMDGSYHYFRMVSLDDPNGFHRKKIVAGMNFGFAWTYQEWRMFEEDTYREYENLTPEVLREIAIELFVKIENSHRGEILWQYERAVDRKREAVERLEEKRRIAAIRRRENTDRIVAKRFELMDETLLLLTKSDQIRELITAMDKKIESAKKPIPHYKKWRAWAEHQANSIDPRNMSVKRAGRWVEKFEFQ